MKILFRAKRAIFTDGEYKPSKDWIYWYYFYNTNTKHPHYIKEQDSGMEYKVVGETVGQLLWTNKDWSNIFEGDIVKKVKNQNWELTKKSRIMRKFTDYIWNDITKRNKLIQDRIKLIEDIRFLYVVGNIYDK